MTVRAIRTLAFTALTILAAAGGRATAAPDLKKAVGDWIAAFNAHDVAGSQALHAPDVVIANVTPKGWSEQRGRAAVAQALEPYFKAFPDVRLAATRVFHKGDLAIVEWAAAGTNTGSLGGAPPSGKPAGVRGVSLLWFDKKGLVRRTETVFDEATLAQQTGLAPGPARAVPALPTAAPEWIEAGDATAAAKTVATAKAGWPTSWSKHDRAAYDASVTDDGAHLELAGPNDFKGRAALMAEFDMYAKALPDMRAQITQAWAFGDVAILKFTFTGTMKGPIGPFKPTNKKLVIHGIDVDELRDGKMALGATYSNGVELLTELGALPPPPASAAARP